MAGNRYGWGTVLGPYSEAFGEEDERYGDVCGVGEWEYYPDSGYG